MNSRPASSWDTMDGEGGGGAASGGGNPYGQSDVEQSDAEEAADKEPPGDDTDQFHAQFMQRMRQQADDAARSREKAAQELMGTGDDAMDALVEEFPDMAEHADVDSDSDSDAEAAKLAEVARAKKKELPRVDHSTSCEQRLFTPPAVNRSCRASTTRASPTCRSERTFTSRCRRSSA